MFSPNSVSQSLLDAVNGVIEENKDCVTKPEAKEVAKGEVNKHEKDMHKEEVENVEEGIGDVVKKVVKAGAKAVVKGAKALGGPDDEGHRKDLQRKMGIPQTGRPGHAKYNEEATPFTLKDRLVEREMTKGEINKRHEIMQGLEDNKAYFKKKYGNNWKEVMGATATKKAMGESLEHVEEQADVSTDTLAGRVQGVGQSNSFKNFKVKIEGSQKTAREPSTQEAPHTAAKQSITAHGGAVPSPKIGVAEEYDEAVVAELIEFMQTEEYEQLDELKKSTLASYVKKAADDVGYHAHQMGYHNAKKDTKTAYNHNKKELSRMKGISKATDKLAKESWDAMLSAVKKKNEPKPNGGSGVKQGTAYGGGKQADEKKK